MTVKTETVKQDWTGMKSEGLAQSVKATLYIYVYIYIKLIYIYIYIYIYMSHLIEKVLFVLAGRHKHVYKSRQSSRGYQGED